MNCTKCNKPMEENARFCPNCGELVSQTPLNPVPSSPPAFTGEPPTLPPAYQKNEPLILRPGQQGQGPQYQGQAAIQHSSQPAYPPNQAQPWSQPPPAGPQQPSYYPPGRAAPGRNSNASAGETKPRRRGRGCLVALLTILVLLAVLVGGWFFALRPYLNNLALNKLDSSLSNAVNNIPPPVVLAPAGPIPVPENALNILLAFGSSSNDLVQNPKVHFTPGTVTLQFQVFGFPCTVTGVPKVVQKQLVVTNVTVDGIAGLILSPEDITALVNRHIAEAQAKIQHPIESVQVNNQQLILVLGAPSNSPLPGGLPPLPGGTPPPLPGGTPPTIP